MISSFKLLLYIMKLNLKRINSFVVSALLTSCENRQYATCGRRYFCIRIKNFADTKISGYVWTGLTFATSKTFFCFDLFVFFLSIFLFSDALIQSGQTANDSSC